MTTEEAAELYYLERRWKSALCTQGEIQRYMQLVRKGNREVEAANAKENELIWGESHDTGRR